MEFLLSRYRNLTALLLVILAQLVLLAWQVKSNEDVRLIRVWSVTAVTPLARVLEFVREHTIGVVEDYFVLINVRNENKQLQEELGRLKLENNFLRNELSTAERATALQAFQQRTPSRTLPARIIGTGTGANSSMVFIDQGSSKGVMRGMAVVTPDGIVGKVLAAYPTASQVLLITDASFAAGVISEKNRIHGTLKGKGQSKVIVDYVQNEEKVEQNEMFYTSGDDRIFPKGFPVGRVTVARDGNPFKEIYIVPSGFQHGLEEVLVVIEGVHGQLPDPTKTAAAPGVYLMPPPPDAQKAAEQPQPGATPASATNPAAAAMMTDADRLRERYKRIGEAQGISYGNPGRVPNFNVDPNAAPRPAAPPAGQPPASGTGTQTAPSGQTAAPATGAQTTTPARPAPSGATPATPGVQRPAQPGGATPPAANPQRTPVPQSSAPPTTQAPTRTQQNVGSVPVTPRTVSPQPGTPKPSPERTTTQPR